VKALDLKAVRELKGMKSQTITIALVGACGVAILISFLTAYDSLKLAVDSFYTHSRFGQVFASAKRAPNSLLSVIENIPGVNVVESRIIFDAALELDVATGPVIGRFVSLPDDRPQILNQIYIRKGKVPDPYSLDEIVVSEAFAMANRIEPGSELRAIINGRMRHLTVAGTGLSPEYIYAFRGASPLPDDRHFGIIWISERTLSGLLDMRGSWNNISMTLEPGAPVEEVIHSVDQILADYGGPGAVKKAQHPSNFFLENELMQLKTEGWIIPIVFLGVAAFLLHVVIGRIINRQREQIATLKALGYSNFRISMHYLSIVALMIMLGVAIGILPGIWLGQVFTEMYRSYFHFPTFYFVLDPFVILEAAAASLAAASLGALGSLMQAFRLAPAEAMRPPAPPLFQKSLIERMLFMLSSAGKMAVRNVTIRPVRSGLSVLGLSFAMGIVIIAFIYIDMINFLMAFQFNVAEHEDANVIFNSAVSSRSIHELQSMPGVIYAEGYRITPVRIHFGQKTKDTALTGYPQNLRLRRIMNSDFKSLRMPPEGLLLNVRLAEKLGARPGDTLMIEILEGERRTVPVQLAAVVEELLGAGAYMDIRTMNTLLREDSLISMASVTVDPLVSESIYSRLRNFPMVATVDTKQALLDVFQRMIGDMMTTMAIAMIAFASVIAVGVVYNMVMVSLSERAWELASLRVLGFTRAEVFRVLIGEIVVQILLSLPMGVFIGYWIMFAMMASISSQVETYYFPIIITPSAIALSVATIVTAAFFSALLVRRRINKLDLVAVLKLRE